MKSSPLSYYTIIAHQELSKKKDPSNFGKGDENFFIDEFSGLESLDKYCESLIPGLDRTVVWFNLGNFYFARKSINHFLEKYTTKPFHKEFEKNYQKWVAFRRFLINSMLC